MADGIKRQWRWYKPVDEGEPITRTEFRDLNRDGRAALLEVMKRYAHDECRRDEVKHLTGSDGLWELRVKLGSDPYRLLFFKDTPVHYVVVLTVYKNQKKLPKGDLTKATKRMKDWQARKGK